MNKNFSVPNPCHEKWDGMQPKENGRYCGSCQKVVIDFTNKTNDEILDYIKENSRKQLCGTFKNSQLPASNQFQQHENSIRFLAALLLVFGMTLFSCSSVDLGDKPEPDAEPKHHYDGTTIGVMVVPIDTVKKRAHHAYYNNGGIKVVDEEPVCEITGIIIPTRTPIPMTTGEIIPPAEHDTIRIKKEEEIFTIVDQMPEFPGGISKMMEFIASNIQYPNSCSEMGIQGIVYVSFVVRKDGTIDDIRLLKGVHEAIDKEALRVVGMMPKWVPGKNSGREVDVRFALPIKFRLK